MTDLELMNLAEEVGFAAAMIAPKDIPVNPEFRTFCEQNLCGRYNANYACPPDCGSVEELRARTLAEERAMIITSQWEIHGYEDVEGIELGKRAHNAAVIRLMDQIRRQGYEGFAAGYNGCPLCDPCRRILNEPCPFPEKRISCMSAYCIDVTELARRCGLEFAWSPNKLHLVGMIAIHRVK